MSPLVSVVLPYRDAGETIDEALESLLSQRGVRLEVVAVDDRSGDDGPARVLRARRGDDRIRMVEAGGEGGIVGALRAGLIAARGDFIARMDADDISLPERLALQRDALLADPALGAVGTQVEAFPEEAVGGGMRRYVAWQNAIITPEEHAREIFIESPLCHPSVMMRRSALDRAGGYREGPWPEDYDLWLRLDALGLRLAKVPQVLLRWRHRVGRATFSDPRYAIARFIEAKCHYLAPRLAALEVAGAGAGAGGESERAGEGARRLVVWGAGKTGRAVARSLANAGARASLFIDIDPRKIGRTAQGAPIAAPAELARGRHFVVVAVGARGARELIRAHLDGAGFREGVDYLCAA